MIYIDRNKVDVPITLISENKDREFNKMQAFFVRPNKPKVKQIEFRFKIKLYSSNYVKDGLKKLFNNKCAYCESMIANSFPDVDHFRPKRNAMRMNGEIDHDHYWWLAYEWQNLYLSCQVCNRSKMSRFPVLGKRLSYGDDVDQEKALLIDPCYKNDFQEEHLSFSLDGRVHPNTEKGDFTIKILNLNREVLVSQRKQAIERTRFIFNALVSESNLKIRDAFKEFDELFSPKSEFIAAKKSFIHAYLLEEKNNKKFADFIRRFSNKLQPRNFNFEEFKSSKTIDKISVTAKGIKSISDPSKENFLESYSVEEEDYFTLTKAINKIEISNFKIIESLELEFPKGSTSDMPWMVLLGENGSGKSTVLQSIALTLMGSEKANRLGIDASKLVNRKSRKRKGFVKIYMEGVEAPLELHLSKDSSKFSSSSENHQMTLVAFGSTRLMSKSDAERKFTGLENIQNLFDPYTQLLDVESWLSDPKEVPTNIFDEIAIELKNILFLPEDKLIYRRKTGSKYELFIQTKQNHPGLKIHDLSSGYQSVIVLVLSIIRETLKTWKHFKVAEGFVFIDEIGVHLHPRWKMQVVKTLRNTFPALTFIITTHEPLCLRGVDEGEVILMKFDENDSVIAIDDLPSPKHLTLEQLITSNLFGLISSFDPEVEIKLNTYYRLRSKHKITATEKKQLKNLTKELKEMNQIGELSKMGQVKKAVDDIIATKKYVDTSLDSKTIDTKIKKKIGNSWKRRFGK